MKNYLMAAACAVALSLSACTERTESYAVKSSEAFATLASAGYAYGIYPLPSGIGARDVTLSFEAVPTDQTAYWAFTRNGKEIARVHAVVEGDETSSTISYSYAEGEGAADEKKLERQIKLHMPLLIAEAVDAKIENRAFDQSMKSQADAVSMTASMGGMMTDANSKMDEAIKKNEERTLQTATVPSRADSVRPMTDLSQY